jgi:hypothetical protein
MEPKDKAKEIVDKFQKQIFFNITNEILDIEEAKGCALIAVDEMLEELDNLAFYDFDYGISKMMYWQQVKHEIEQL